MVGATAIPMIYPLSIPRIAPSMAKTHFGFRDVDEREKTRLVRGVFSSVAARYDLMNDLMSGGVHRLWKDRLVRRIRPCAGETILDLAGGTGDIAFRIVQASEAEVTVCDINEAMVGVGRDRAIDRGRLAGIEWTVGDAEALPFADASMDACCIALARDEASYRYLAESIRQFPDQEGLAAMMRRAGFATVGYESWSGGIVALHHGRKAA